MIGGVAGAAEGCTASVNSSALGDEEGATMMGGTMPGVAAPASMPTANVTAGGTGPVALVVLNGAPQMELAMLSPARFKQKQAIMSVPQWRCPHRPWKAHWRRRAQSKAQPILQAPTRWLPMGLTSSVPETNDGR
eukprot:TRINITY_DN677_c1_g1_i1.p1 TRINITY_DN677_c1_g1~~TRINITY_DN677_c1_g1_i1.p1  ORF type:complete len:135 (+),score=12.29 TRINITY_DN677_c1_g1_i1:1314-1718(+)